MEAVPSESVQLVSEPQRASLARESVRLSTHNVIPSPPHAWAGIGNDKDRNYK